MGLMTDLFGRDGRTVAARSKPHRFTTNETDFFAQRVLRYWNSLPARVSSVDWMPFGLVDIKLISLATTGNFHMIFLIGLKFL